jgi:hypothetical protein
MGIVARAVHAGGGTVIGVMPEWMLALDIGYLLADELIVTPDMRTRKATMEARADGFIALPGGIGTFEELLETTTNKQLGLHAKPVVAINTDGYFDPLIAQFDRMIVEGFTKPAFRDVLHFAPDPAAEMEYLESYEPAAVGSKWF